jgi:hypothetical protein
MLASWVETLAVPASGWKWTAPVGFLRSSSRLEIPNAGARDASRRMQNSMALDPSHRMIRE